MPTCGLISSCKAVGPAGGSSFLLRLSRKRESGCCLHLPATAFRPLWIVKNREPDLNWLKQKGLFWLIWLKRHGDLQGLSNHVIRTLSLSPWLCLSDCTLRLHMVAFRAAVSSPRCTVSAFSSFLEKSWTSCWLAWLRSWTILEPVPEFRDISSSPHPPAWKTGASPEHGE